MDNPWIDGRRPPIEVDSDFGSAREGWERLDWDCCVAYGIEDRRETAANRAQPSEAKSDTRPANEDAGYAVDTVEDIP